jgi:hypothetical protein
VAKTTVHKSPSTFRLDPAADKVLEALFASINPNVPTSQGLYKGTQRRENPKSEMLWKAAEMSVSGFEPPCDNPKLMT